MIAATLILTVLTGFTGLVYEVAWERYLATLLGSHSEATAAVLGLYLGGLALGYAVFGRVARRGTQGIDPVLARTRLVRLYGTVEIGIGLYALAFRWLFEAVRVLSLALPGADGIAAFAIDVTLSALLILPPTLLMGGTIPLLTQALPVSVAGATRLHALVYGCNTLGATAGALGAAFFLIPELGLAGVMTAMAVINVLAGAIFWWLGSRSPAEAATPDPEPVMPVRAPAIYLAIAFLVGFAMMTLQATVIRVGGLSLGASPFTFAIVVAIFVLGIGVGSLAIGAVSRVPDRALASSLALLGVWLLGLYGLLEAAPYGAHVLRTMFRDHPAAFGLYSSLVLVAGWLFVGPAAVLSGVTLPLVFHQLRGRYGLLGQAAGSLYSWNTLGSLFGALLGGYAFFFWMDLHHVYRVATLAVLAAAALAVWLDGPGRFRNAMAGAFAMGAVVLVLLPAWRPEAIAAGMFRVRGPAEASYDGLDAMLREMVGDDRLLFHDDDPIATVTVPEIRVDGDRTLSLVTNGKSDGNTRDDYPTMSLAALIPAVLTEPVVSAFVIGFGTGITAGELAGLDGVERVVVAEISPGVVEAAELFDFASLGASKHPKIEIVRSDAYRALSRSGERYDLIISEPSNPWVAGVEMLFTREFYAASAARLSDHGLFVQWIHEYESDSEALELVLRTFNDAFGRSAIWYGNGPDLILVGFAAGAPEPDFLSVARRAQRPEVVAGLQRAGIRSLPELLAHELVPVGVVNRIPLSGPLHRLYHPRLNDVAARAFFAGRTATLPFSGAGETARLGTAKSLFGQYAIRRAARGGLTEREWAAFAGEVCEHRTRECIAALARWRAAFPDSAGPNRVRERRLRARGGAAFPGDAIPHVARLFDSESVAQLPSVGPGQLLHASRLYADYYFHAVPFDPAAMRRFAERCEASPQAPDACKNARQTARQRLRVGDAAAPPR